MKILKIPQKKIKKILIIKNDKIGDMVLSTNIFRELRKNFARAEITVIASNVNKELIEKNKNINEIIVLDYPTKINVNLLKAIFDYFKLSRNIRKQNYDLGVDLRGSIFNSLILLTLGKVRYRIGFYNRLLSKFFLDYAYKKDRKNKHVTFQRIDLINKALGINAKNSWPDIQTDEKDSKKVQMIIKKYKLNNFVCIFPVASFEKKQLSLEKFDFLIKYIYKKYGKYKIVLMGSEQDRSKINCLLKKNKFCILITNLNLRELYLLLKKSSLVIAHDGGAMHLAWTAKTNLIALMLGSLPVNYLKPLNKNSRTIISRKENMNSITLEKIEKEIDFFLNKSGGKDER